MSLLKQYSPERQPAGSPLSALAKATRTTGAGVLLHGVLCPLDGALSFAVKYAAAHGLVHMDAIAALTSLHERLAEDLEGIIASTDLFAVTEHRAHVAAHYTADIVLPLMTMFAYVGIKGAVRRCYAYARRSH